MILVYIIFEILTSSLAIDLELSFDVLRLTLLVSLQ